MKNILVAIDFSPDSIHALEYAIDISNKMEANIKMIWIHKELSSFLPFTKGQTKEDRNVQVVRSFEKLIFKYQDFIKGDFSYCIRDGKVHEQIALVAKEEKMDLVIAGTHGISGFDEFWVGSNAFRIISFTEVPVITIRENFDFSGGIKRIVLPLDASQETRQKVPFASKIARIFNAKIDIISLFPSKDSALNTIIRQYTKQVVNFLEEEGVAYYQIDLISEDFEKQALSYAREVNADLIAIVAVMSRSPLNVIFSTNARPIINHSEIPVLSVTERENLFPNSTF
jgi:nucleotide-binding universal stress UspA family protein